MWVADIAWAMPLLNIHNMKHPETASSPQQVINNYFEGIFKGDVQKLSASFWEGAYLWGDIKGASYKKSLAEYLEAVRNRKSPHALGEAFKMEILSLEVVGNIALARLHLPMLGYNYYDFLSLTLLDGEWKIINKLFAHVE